MANYDRSSPEMRSVQSQRHRRTLLRNTTGDKSAGFIRTPAIRCAIARRPHSQFTDRLLASQRVPGESPISSPSGSTSRHCQSPPSGPWLRDALRLPIWRATVASVVRLSLARATVQQLLTQLIGADDAVCTAQLLKPVVVIPWPVTMR